MPNLGVSLRTRLTLWYGALLALTLLAFSGLVYFTLQRNLSSSMDERLTLRAKQIVLDVGPNIGNLLQPEDVTPGQSESALVAFVEPGIYVQVLSSKGAILAAPPNLFGAELPVPQSSRQAILQDTIIFDTIQVVSPDVNVRLLTEPIHQQGTQEVVGAVQVAESLTPFENTMLAVERLLLSAGLGMVVLAVVVGWLLTRAALSPVARITETARHIAATGDYRRRLNVQPPRFGHGDELFFLASTFNAMIARLEHVLESQRRLLADTSHELRNPITIIRGNLALLRREGVPELTQHEAVVEAEEEAARMGRLVSDLLLLARADAGGAPSLQLEPVDLAELASEVVEQARARATDRRMSLASDGQCIVMGDRDRLRQLIANLVENSIRYTPRNGRIDVSVTGPAEVAGVQQRATSTRSRKAREPYGSSSMVLLTVADSGLGISPTDLPHVFERFFRADKARSRAHGGSGLGLSIAEYIVQAHGGSIQAASQGTNRGSVFSVQLPRLDQPAPLRSKTPRQSPGVAVHVPLGR